ncbi:hypothetical protein DM02DRAFT_614382 [Periconia macrospinosa]|uniref:NAD-dependent epimerase/dehydratase domain-containing protein n=1 Tax=Periconia macrospinosa TaxID=97972 RepID=A0A2V1DT49_9PLEO|nr:hypothetical protein DM02DRAFT_614382 [Periconia macrospinosa]
MVHLILTGATGLIGSSVLHHMLNDAAVSRVSILSRRPVDMAQGHEDKVKVFIHKDFNKYDQTLLDELKDAQGCVWALGVSQNEVNKTQYVEITRDYTMAAANAFASIHPTSPFTFVFVSGEGATQNPGVLTPIYGRVKGQTEQDLVDFGESKKGMFNVYSVRPAGVDPRHHQEIHQYMPNQPLWKTTTLGVLGTIYKPMISPTKPFAKVFTELALSKGEPLKGEGLQLGGRVVPNVVLRRMAGL